MVDSHDCDGAAGSGCVSTDGVSGLLDWGRLDGPHRDDRLVCTCQ